MLFSLGKYGSEPEFEEKSNSHLKITSTVMLCSVELVHLTQAYRTECPRVGSREITLVSLLVYYVYLRSTPVIHYLAESPRAKRAVLTHTTSASCLPLTGIDFGII